MNGVFFFCTSPDSLEHTFLACSVAEDFFYEMMTWSNTFSSSESTIVWPAAGIESSGSNHFKITKEITEFWPSGLTQSSSMAHARNSCSQSSRFLPQARRIVGSGYEKGFNNEQKSQINSGAPAARRAAKRSPISNPYMGNKREPMS